MRRTILVLCALLVAVSGAEAVVFTLDPSALVVSPGDSVSLDLVASGLGGAVIGDFDLDIDFDPARLTLTGFTLANGLGDVSSGEALDFSLGLVVPGLLNLAVVSTLSEAELLAVQSDPLTVATLTVDVGALGPGTSTTVAGGHRQRAGRGRRRGPVGHRAGRCHPPCPRRNRSGTWQPLAGGEWATRVRRDAEAHPQNLLVKWSGGSGVAPPRRESSP